MSSAKSSEYVPANDSELIRFAREQARGINSSADIGLSLELDKHGTPFQGPPADSFAGYTIIREIYCGGQGAVFQAFQESTRRTVAIKVMKEGPFAGAADQARFDREVRVLGQLNHPNIVTIHDSGVALGHHYFVMDYVPGQPLDVHLAGVPQPIDAALRLFGKICEAVNTAHLRGIIHRDLKPGNIRIDTEGEPHILDFGLAKVAADEASASLMTMTGQFVGSLPWASPEQAEGIPARVDVRTDVYSLGVILYQMLTGTFPYDVSGTVHDVLDNIMGSEPTRPSMIRKQIDDEVETIVLKCLNKGRERRYQTAGELGRDIQHYLRGEPIEAKRDSVGYLLRKQLTRNRLAVAVVAGFALLITVGFLTALAFWRLSLEANSEAVRARGELAVANEQLTVAHLSARRQAYAANVFAAGSALSMNETVATRQHLEAAEVEFRNWEWRFVSAQADCSLATLQGHTWDVASVAFSSDGAQLASGSLDGTVRIWDVDTHNPVATLREHRGRIRCVAFASNGSRLASASEDGTVRIWDAATGETLTVLPGHTAWVTSVAFGMGDTRLATASADYTVRIWDAVTGQPLAVLRGHNGPVRSVAFSPDGTRLASAALGDCTVRLWDAVGGKAEAVLSGHESAVFSVTFSPDGTRLASASRDKTVRLWDAATGEALAVLPCPGGYITYAVAFSPDGTRLALAGDDRAVHIWDSSTGQELAARRGHEEGLWSVAFSPDGKLLASGARDATVRLWDASTGEQLAALAGHGDWVRSVTFSPDGTILASASNDRTVRTWDASTGEALAVLPGHDGWVYAVSFSPDGTRLASGSQDKSIRLWEASTGQELAVMAGHGGKIWDLKFSSDGTRLASASDDGTARLWDPATGEELTVLRGHEWNVCSVAFNPDGTRLASGSWDKTVRLWDVSTGEALFVLRGHDHRVLSVAFSPDGTRLASTSWDKTVRLWDVATGEELTVLRGHDQWVNFVTFSPDGARLASASVDKTVRVWDSVPYGVRYRERQAILAARPEAERTVKDLWQSSRDWKFITKRLRGDASLGEPTRRAALNVVLRLASQTRSPYSDAPDQQP